MPATLSAVLASAALPLALVVSPYLLSRCFYRTPRAVPALAAAAAASIALNTLVPLVLVLLGAALTPSAMACAHALLAALLYLAVRLTKAPLRVGVSPALRGLAGPSVLLAALLLPVTPLAGIDTYKWIDLAQAVRVEQTVPWLAHPWSLFGFTPRSYPSAQPLLMATIQILGPRGVESSYYAVSLLTAATGLLSAACLGQRLFGTPRRACLLAVLYAFSPVFMRYTHWATGRGLFLALFPLFLAAVAGRSSRRSLVSLPLLALLLLLSHKTAWVALALSALSLATAPLLPRRRALLSIVLLALPFAAAALALSPAHGLTARLAGVARSSAVRFGVLLPLALAGLPAQRAWLRGRSLRPLLPLGLAALPLSYTADMYGAMIALGPLSVAAALGLFAIEARFARARRVIRAAVLLLAAAGAAAIVAHRCAGAMPTRLRAAALFLERYDPRGPSRVHAPGRARPLIQAYLSGCPRFTVQAGGGPRTRLDAPPRPAGGPAETARAWSDYLRRAIAVEGLHVSWYGPLRREYFVTVDGRGRRPPDAQPLYQRRGVAVYREPRHSHPPPPP